MDELASHNSVTPPEDHVSPVICQICKMGNKQIQCILYSLLQCLQNTSVEQVEDTSHDNGGFTKLLRLIFYSRCKNFRDTIKCRHQKARDFFLDKLQTNATHLNRLSNVKLNSLAKYNFHLDTISQQIKTFTRHFSTGLDRKKIVRPKPKQKEIEADNSGATEKTLRKQGQKCQSPKEVTVKEEVDMDGSAELGAGGQYLYEQVGAYPFQHALSYGPDYARLVNSMILMNYGYHHPSQP